jgi:xeroderma pigmentosum group C-complementing protein
VKPVDLEAQMKRKLNRHRKEYQVRLHKVNLIAWVAHGNYVNSKLNDTQLMGGALKLLPKNENHCYPTDKTDIDYFKQITNWFKSTIKLNNKDMYCFLNKRPPIMTSLALQMKFKTAICRRDYVLIFVILLRAIGIQCRVVQSLVCAPLLPPKSDLLSLAKVPEAKSKQSGSKTNRCGKSKAKGSSKSSHKLPEKSSTDSRSKSRKSIRIPQLDGSDDLPRGSKKPLKIKALPGYKVDESYVDLDKDNNVKKVGESSKGTSRTKMDPRVKFSLDSPNRAKSPSDKLFKEKKASGSKNPVAKVQEKEALKVISPRKTRSKVRNESEKTIESAEKSAKKVEAKGNATSSSTNKKKSGEEISSKLSNSKPKDALQVFSPRRLRSRSRSNEGEITKASCDESKPESSSKSVINEKPNLKNLQKVNDRKRPSSSKEEVDDAKKPKTSGKKRESSSMMKCRKKILMIRRNISRHHLSRKNQKLQHRQRKSTDVCFHLKTKTLTPPLLLNKSR